MKFNRTALVILMASASVFSVSCGKHKSNSSNGGTTNIVPGSDATLHDGQSGPVYTVPHPEDCGTCDTAAITDVDGCGLVGTAVACEGTCFVDSNVLTTYYSNPPTSGPEYDYYDYNFYDVANLPRGEYVRNMFHGSVILAYNCSDAACEAIVNQLKPYGTLGSTPLPGYGVIVTQDTALPANTFYALSWTYSYQFTSFDKATLECFIRQHYGHGMDAENTADAPAATPTPAG